MVKTRINPDLPQNDNMEEIDLNWADEAPSIVLSRDAINALSSQELCELFGVSPSRDRQSTLSMRCALEQLDS